MNTMKMGGTAIFLSLFLTLAVMAVMAATPNQYRLQRDGFTSGGGHLTSSTYQTESWLGKNDFGQMQSPSYRLGPATAVTEAKQSLPLNFRLEQNYPNPFNQATQLSWQVAQPGAVEIALYSLSGRKLKVIYAGQQAPGHYRLQYDGRDATGRPLPSGVYFCRLTTAFYTAIIKLLIVR